MNKKASPFSSEKAGDSTGFLLWQVTTLWQRRIAAALRPLGLTQVQYALLASLLWLSRTESSITQAMLARHGKLDVMMTSQVLRALQAKGLLRRKPHPTDARARVLTLTVKGGSLTRSAVPVVEKADSVFFSALAGRRGKFNESLSALISPDPSSK